MVPRFYGNIVGVGSSEGVRAVLGLWDQGPFGTFADAMVETKGGHRILLAPSAAVAKFVSAVYYFDEIRLEDIRWQRSPHSIQFRSNSLNLSLALGPRTPLGYLLRTQPSILLGTRTWAKISNLFAPLCGVRTYGRAQLGSTEWYAARDQYTVNRVSGTWQGTDWGDLAPVYPPVKFGFSSTPKRPGITQVISTIAHDSSAQALMPSPVTSPGLDNETTSEPGRT
jgi:hypothetical protein